MNGTREIHTGFEESKHAAASGNTLKSGQSSQRKQKTQMAAEACAAECVKQIAISRFGRPHLGSFRAIKNFGAHLGLCVEAIASNIQPKPILLDGSGSSASSGSAQVRSLQ